MHVQDNIPGMATVLDTFHTRQLSRNRHPSLAQERPMHAISQCTSSDRLSRTRSLSCSICRAVSGTDPDTKVGNNVSKKAACRSQRCAFEHISWALLQGEPPDSKHTPCHPPLSTKQICVHPCRWQEQIMQVMVKLKGEAEEPALTSGNIS